jgi:hypothetical protein
MNSNSNDTEKQAWQRRVCGALLKAVQERGIRAVMEEGLVTVLYSSGDKLYITLENGIWSSRLKGEPFSDGPWTLEDRGKSIRETAEIAIVADAVAKHAIEFAEINGLESPRASAS